MCQFGLLMIDKKVSKVLGKDGNGRDISSNI